MLLTVLLSLLLVLAAVFALGSLITWLVERNPYQPQFTRGRAPNPLPDGFHPGQAHVLLDRQTPWLGKCFDRERQLGFNLFTPLGAKILKVASPFYSRFSVDGAGKTRAYYFKTWVGAGKKDADVQVLKLDYAAVRENPLFIRIILDEVVETAPGRYLGKIHVKLLPGFFVTIGYFGLAVQAATAAVPAVAASSEVGISSAPASL